MILTVIPILVSVISVPVVTRIIIILLISLETAVYSLLPAASSVAPRTVSVT